MAARPPITRDTRVAALLRDYPETEELLIGMSPAFAKLRNPVLRRSVARVATLDHAAAVGRLPAAVLVNELRAAVGQDPIEVVDEDSADYFGGQPEWFDPELVVAVLRDDELDPDVMPINPLLRAVKDLEDGQIVELVTSHLPAPGIDIVRRRGHRTWTTDDDRSIRTFVLKVAAG
ncbi:MAG: DUF1858 domain-containing protein [bacterium]|nr:DUF1858 domain-containing protein [bacterium]